MDESIRSVSINLDKMHKSVFERGHGQPSLESEGDDASFEHGHQ
jgi:hypothetical protein